MPKQYSLDAESENSLKNSCPPGQAWLLDLRYLSAFLLEEDASSVESAAPPREPGITPETEDTDSLSEIEQWYDPLGES